MTEFESAFFGDLEKMAPSVVIGVVISFAILGILAMYGPISASFDFEMRALDRGFTWNDKRESTCL